MTYALSWSFSHASYGIGHTPLSFIAPYVPVTGVLSTVTTNTRTLEDLCYRLIDSLQHLSHLRNCITEGHDPKIEQIGKRIIAKHSSDMIVVVSNMKP